MDSSPISLRGLCATHLLDEKWLTLLHRKGYDRGAALDSYTHWWPLAWDRGGTLTKALSPASTKKISAERLQAVEDHASRDSQSNGSLMRISPLGIFYAGRPGEAADRAREDSRLTHPNPVCQDACAVFVAAIAAAIAGGGKVHDCYQAALAEADRSHVQPAVLQALQNATNAAPMDYWGNQGRAPIALQNAFFQLLHAPTLEDEWSTR